MATFIDRKGDHKKETLVKILTESIIEPKVSEIRVGKGRKVYGAKPSFSFYREDRYGLYVPPVIAQRHIGFTRNLWKEDVQVESLDISLRSHQKDALKKVAKFTDKSFSCLLHLPPGFGKTILSSVIWEKLCDGPLAILINRTVLIESWKNTIEMCFKDAKVWVVGEERVDRPDIVLCMAGRASTLDIDDRRRINTLIIDEGHLFCTTSHVSAIMSFCCDNIIIDTATPVRDDEQHRMLEFLVPREKWVRYISKIPYIVHVINTCTNLRGLCTKNGQDGTWGQRVNEAHADNDRNEIIFDLINNAYKSKLKVMVLTTTKKHVETLDALIHERIDAQTMMYYHTVKKCTNYDVLIGTMPKVGTGYDEATSCVDWDGIKSNILILCTSVKSVGLFEQLVGRVMRSNAPHIVWLMDNDSSCKSHLSGLKKYIKSTNGVLRNEKSYHNIDFSEKIEYKGKPYEYISDLSQR